MAGTFQDILSRKVSEVERPEPMPLGHYHFVNPALPKLADNVGKDSQKVVEFTLSLVQPQEDVDLEQLRDYTSRFGQFPKPVRLSFFITRADGSVDLWPLKRFLTETLKIPDGGDEDFQRMINDSVNRQGIAKIKHRPDKNGTQLYPEVESTLPI